MQCFRQLFSYHSDNIDIRRPYSIGLFHHAGIENVGQFVNLSLAMVSPYVFLPLVYVSSVITNLIHKYS